MSSSQDPPTSSSVGAPRNGTRSDLPSIDEVSGTFSLAAPRVPRDLADTISDPPWWRSGWVVLAIVCTLLITAYRWTCG